MNAEQIIYTSCKRGIRGGASGLQIYSCSSQAEDWMANNQIGILFSYQPPMENLPILPTEEEAKTLFPKRFYYNPIKGIDNLCGMSLCTYIGRDYPEGSQRPGNFLGHGVVAPKQDFDEYPCQLLNLHGFIHWLDRALVRSDNAPQPLPQIKLSLISDAVTVELPAFLAEHNRIEIYKQMLACVLNGKDEKYSQIRHIIIADTQENIKMWITALQMAFPLKNALEIGFSTYEFDPIKSEANIVGAATETYYSLPSDNQTFDYYFDFFQENFDQTDYSRFDDFCNFIADGMLYSYENVQAFHRFLSNYKYFTVDTKIQAAYTLCLYLDGSLNIDDFSAEQLRDAFSFSLLYATEPVHNTLVKRALEYFKQQLYEEPFNSILVDFISSAIISTTFDGRWIVESIVELIVQCFANPTVLAKDFSNLYMHLEQCFQTQGFSLKSAFLEQIEKYDISKIVTAETPWKALLLISVLATELKNINAVLDVGSFPSIIIKQSILCVAHQQPQMAYQMIEAILVEYGKIGAEALSVFYVAIRNVDAINSHPSTIEQVRSAYFMSLGEYSTENMIVAFQTLNQQHYENEIDLFLTEMVASESFNCFFTVQAIEKKMPEYFKTHKSKLMEECINSASNFRDKYTIFMFAQKTNALSLDASACLLNQIASELPLVDTQGKYSEYTVNLYKECEKSGIYIPNRILLANFYLHTCQLSDRANKLFSSDRQTQKSVNELLETKGIQLIDISPEESQEYLSALFMPITILMCKTFDFSLQSQLLILTKDAQLRFSYDLLKNICKYLKKTHDTYPLLCLLIYDAQFHPDVRKYFAAALTSENFTAAAIDKAINKHQKDLLNYRAKIMVNCNAPNSLDAFWNQLNGEMKQIEPTSSDRFRAHFKKK